MELSTLATFIKVAEHLNITRAAEELFLSQPAVTKQIKALEAELGAELLVRSPRGLSLSPAGAVVLPTLRQICDMVNRVRDQAHEASGRGHLVLAAGSVTMTYVLPPILAAFRERLPLAEVTVLSGKTTDVVRMVDEGQAHVGLVTSEVTHRGLIVEPLFWDPLGVVAAPNRPLATTLEDLAHEPWLLFARGTGFRTFIDSLFVAAGVTPRVVMELESVEALREMAAIGLGYTILPLTAVQDLLQQGRLVQLPIQSGIRLARHNSLIYRPDPGLQVAREFIAIARENLGEADARSPQPTARS
ncbi:MAG: LysR family transcriptional regulator [Bacillota bacterium]